MGKCVSSANPQLDDMSASVQQVQVEPVQGVAAQSYVMPDMFASPGLTMVPGQLQPAQTVTYAAPAVTYAAAPVATYASPAVTYAAPAAGSVVYAAPQAGSVTYAAAEPTGSVTYAAPMQTMTYAAPATYSAPVGGQPVYTISPERFQRIMAGEPLTNEEIAQMTGQAAAPIATQAGGQNLAMPDMFASPGLTMVGGPQGEFSQPAASASTVAAATTFEPTAAPIAAAASEKKSSSKKSDKKKSDKKKTSSKKKSKGCC